MNRTFTPVKPATALKSVFLFFVFTALMANVGWGQIALRGSNTALSWKETITINKPSGVTQGDIMIASISELDVNADALSDPSLSGWTLIPGVVNVGGGSAKHCALFYKIATASEPASYTFTLTGSPVPPNIYTVYTHSIGSIVAFSGVDAANPFDAIGTMNSQLSHTPSTGLSAPSITTTTDNCAIVLFGMESYFSGGNVDVSFSTWATATSPGVLTEIYDATNYYISVGAAWAPMAIHGVTGAGSAILSKSCTWGAILIALKPPTNLPVSLLNFTGECNSGNKTLSWSTASEINNNYFIVERSSDKNNWTVVGKVAGAGNSNTIQHYSLTDFSAEGETMYYRLTQVDFDGASETFDAVAVSCNDSNPEISCYPNPFTDQLVVTLQNIATEQGSIILRDISGRQIIYLELGSIDFESNTFIIELSGIASGVYSLEFRTGSYEKTMRVVKHD